MGQSTEQVQSTSEKIIAPIDSECDRLIAQRTPLAVVNYIGLLSSIWVTAHTFQDHPNLYWAAAAIIIFNLVRTCISSFQIPLYSASRKLWLLVCGLLLCGTALRWGTLCWVVLSIYGFSSPTTLLVLLVISGTAAGAITSLSTHRKFGALSITAILGAPLVQLVTSHNYDLAAVFIVYLVFLLVQSRIQCRQIRNGLEREYQFIALSEASF